MTPSRDLVRLHVDLDAAGGRKVQMPRAPVMSAAAGRAVRVHSVRPLDLARRRMRTSRRAGTCTA